MKIIHTADLHIGQILYQNYDRTQEHCHFFDQLVKWCKEENPDALVVCGDIFDIQQPSATTKQAFTDWFVEIRKQCPHMKIAIIAGNHDSASRMQADSAIWEFADAKISGTPPPSHITEEDEGWESNFIVEMESGYIVTIPYSSGCKKEILQCILNKVKERNTENMPVVMMAHLAVTGSDATGHDFEIGTIKTTDVQEMGEGWDYLALGHIHKPQTLNFGEEIHSQTETHPAPVARYSGSALHVSCDEKYPHSVSVVEIDKHAGTVNIRKLKIDELFHFYELPAEPGKFFATEKDALDAILEFAAKGNTGYIRLKMEYTADISSNFNQMVYEIIERSANKDSIRYNPRIIWHGAPDNSKENGTDQKFEIEDLQQMTDPVQFIEKTIDKYPHLNIDEIREAFIEVEKEVQALKEMEK